MATDCRNHGDTMHCMTCNAYGEAIGEGIRGMIMADETVTARKETPGWPKSYCSVIFQRGQFSWTRHPTICTTRAGWRNASAAAAKAIGRSNGKLYYHANYVRPSWSYNCTGREKVGRHIFYSDCHSGGRRQYAHRRHTHWYNARSDDDEGASR